MNARTCRLGLVLSFGGLLTTGCNGSTPTGSPPDWNPVLDPADFVAVVDNPYYPLVPGTTFHYVAETEDGTETNDVIVTHETRQILGITATVVHDQVFLEGDLTEDTFDWYAQDKDGNVWYLGEDSKEIENGRVASTKGSWEAGVNGADPGIIMEADPQVGDEYPQEDAPRVAEDGARVVSLNASPSVPFGQFAGCLETEDFSRIESGKEHKFYCPGTGLVLEASVGSPERNELVGIDHP